MNPQQRRQRQLEEGLTDLELEAEDDREADRYLRDRAEQRYEEEQRTAEENDWERKEK